MSEAQLTCLVTIHGIGEQHAPTASSDGYADGLHRGLLRTSLQGSLLISDPLLAPNTVPEEGRPIYVVGTWPPSPSTVGQGLRRLGGWNTTDRRSVDPTNAPLSAGGSTIAHIAIVYADEQAQGTHGETDLEAAVRTAISLHRYASVGMMLEMPVLAAGAGVKAVLDFFHHPPAQQPPRTTGVGGVETVFRNLDDDVALYVCRNDLRERVRSFVHDALLRLCCRDDVAKVVINSHSNGTVIAADVLRQLPPVASDKIDWLITCGSPLRKYVDLFYWGTDFFCADTGNDAHRYIPQVQRWTNFWDPVDVVADPLAPPPGWHRGDPPGDPADPVRLFRSVVTGTGVTMSIDVDDRKVDNTAHVPSGGYPPHNYWDNQVEVVPELAAIVRKVSIGAPDESMGLIP